MDPQQLAEARGFFTLFHNISETCFSRCVTHLYQRELAKTELDCVDTCLYKFLNVNNQCMYVFSEAAAKRQQEEAQQQQQQLQQQQQEALQALQTAAIALDPAALPNIPPSSSGPL